MARYLALALLLVACSKKAPAGDECQRVVDKTFPIIAEMAKGVGKEMKAEDKAKMLDKCRVSLKEGHRDPAMDCVLSAADEAAVRVCIKQGMGSYAAKSKALEAKMMIKRLERELKAKVAETGEYPAGKTALTPATPCCQMPDQICKPSSSDWSVPVWQSLDFAVEDPSHFQYSYDSDGKTVTAVATGDMQCDGHAETFTLTGKIENGTAVLELTEPQPQPQ